MPKKYEDKLRRRYAKKYPGDKKRQNRAVFGTLAKITGKRKGK